MTVSTPVTACKCGHARNLHDADQPRACLGMTLYTDDSTGPCVCARYRAEQEQPASVTRRVTIIVEEPGKPAVTWRVYAAEDVGIEQTPIYDEDPGPVYFPPSPDQPVLRAVEFHLRCRARPSRNPDDHGNLLAYWLGDNDPNKATT